MAQTCSFTVSTNGLLSNNRRFRKILFQKHRLCFILPYCLLLFSDISEAEASLFLVKNIAASSVIPRTAKIPAKINFFAAALSPSFEALIFCPQYGQKALSPSIFLPHFVQNILHLLPLIQDYFGVCNACYTFVYKNFSGNVTLKSFARLLKSSGVIV